MGGAIPETLWASPLEVDGKIFGFVGAAEDEEEEVVEIPAVAAAFTQSLLGFDFSFSRFLTMKVVLLW